MALPLKGPLSFRMIHDELTSTPWKHLLSDMELPDDLDKPLTDKNKLLLKKLFNSTYKWRDKTSEFKVSLFYGYDALADGPIGPILRKVGGSNFGFQTFRAYLPGNMDRSKVTGVFGDIAGVHSTPFVTRMLFRKKGSNMWEGQSMGGANCTPGILTARFSIDVQTPSGTFSFISAKSNPETIDVTQCTLQKPGIKISRGLASREACVDKYLYKCKVTLTGAKNFYVKINGKYYTKEEFYFELPANPVYANYVATAYVTDGKYDAHHRVIGGTELKTNLFFNATGTDKKPPSDAVSMEAQRVKDDPTGDWFRLVIKDKEKFKFVGHVDVEVKFVSTNFGNSYITLDGCKSLDFQLPGSSCEHYTIKVRYKNRFGSASSYTSLGGHRQSGPCTVPGRGRIMGISHVDSSHVLVRIRPELSGSADKAEVEVSDYKLVGYYRGTTYEVLPGGGSIYIHPGDRCKKKSVRARLHNAFGWGKWSNFQTDWNGNLYSCTAVPPAPKLTIRECSSCANDGYKHYTATIVSSDTSVYKYKLDVDSTPLNGGFFFSARVESDTNEISFKVPCSYSALDLKLYASVKGGNGNNWSKYVALQHTPTTSCVSNLIAKFISTNEILLTLEDYDATMNYIVEYWRHSPKGKQAHIDILGESIVATVSEGCVPYEVQLVTIYKEKPRVRRSASLIVTPICNKVGITVTNIGNRRHKVKLSYHPAHSEVVDMWHVTYGVDMKSEYVGSKDSFECYYDADCSTYKISAYATFKNQAGETARQTTSFKTVCVTDSISEIPTISVKDKAEGKVSVKVSAPKSPSIEGVSIYHVDSNGVGKVDNIQNIQSEYIITVDKCIRYTYYAAYFSAATKGNSSNRVVHLASISCSKPEPPDVMYHKETDGDRVIRVITIPQISFTEQHVKVGIRVTENGVSREVHGTVTRSQLVTLNSTGDIHIEARIGKVHNTVWSDWSIPVSVMDM